MTSALLGDPASISALGASLRRIAVRLTADTAGVESAATDAGEGWRGPRAVHLRRRVDTATEQSRVVASVLDATGRTLQTAATDLSEAISRLREIEDAAAALGLEVREGSVTRGWGITGVADPATERGEHEQRERLQERLHQTVTALGQQRGRLARELARAEEVLHGAGTELRR